MNKAISVRSVWTVLYLLAAIYTLLYVVHDTVGLIRWQKAGYLESRMSQAGDSTVTFLKVIPNDFVSAPYPQNGDTVFQISGQPVTKQVRLRFSPEGRYDIKPIIAEEAIPIGFIHKGDTLRTSFAMHTPTVKLKWAFILVDLLRHLVVLSMLFVGWWGLYSRGETLVVQIFALYCLTRVLGSIGAYFFPLSYGLFPHGFMWFCQSWFPRIFDAFTVSFWLHLQYVFPRTLSWVQKHRRAAYVICYFPAVIFLLNVFVRKFPALSDYLPALLISGDFNQLTSWVFLLAGIAILFYRYNTNSDNLEKRQLRLFIGGSAVGLVVLAIIDLLFLFCFEWYDSSPYVDLVLSGIAYATTLLGPLSFAYAFRKYRLMDIEGKLRRGTRFALVTGVLVTILAGLTYAFSRFVLDEAGINSPTITLAIGFGLAFGIFPLQRRINALLERNFYPERAKLRGLLKEFMQKTSVLFDQESFWQALILRLKDGLKVEAIYALRMDQSSHPFDSDSIVARYLALNQRSLLLDEAISVDGFFLTKDQLQWLRDRRIGMLLPLVFHDKLTAILAIGLRVDDEDYDSEELQILNSLAPQIAIAGENLRLIEENFGKKRLEEELASARDTQKGLLPREIPNCEGLEIAAVCHFCLEVAGDYYDIIPLSKGRTCVAIGDVSGKGASASLLMASLQASLNTVVSIGNELPDIVSRINNLVFRNTSSDQFITFFVGVYDPATSTFDYVNAGHDAPILARADGSIELLEEGGVILGCLPDMPYLEGRVQIKGGDTLLLHTDGLTEAWNSNEEEFGIERIKNFTVASRNLPPAEQIQKLQSAVIDFHQSDQFDDDLTIVIAKFSDSAK